MKARGWSNGDLAGAAGVPYLQVYRLMVEGRTIKLEQVERVAGALGLDLEAKR